VSGAPDEIATLAGLLYTAGLQTTARELADALWLGAHLTPSPRAAPSVAPASAAGTDTGDEPARDEDASARDGAAPRRPPRHRAAVSLFADGRGPGPPSRAAAGRPPAVQVRAPAPPALPGHLEFQRALRPLQRLQLPAPPRRLVLDEEATADASARAMGLVVPVLRPEGRREATLHLVLDASPSMVVWRELFAELRRVFERIGAFRDIQAHYLHSRPDGTAFLGRSPDPNGVGGSADQLRDPSGRSLTLLMTDCTGPLWRKGWAQRVVHRWTEYSPTVLVQPLPHRLWSRTWLPAEPGTLRRGEGRGVPLRFLARGPARTGGRCVPMLPPSPTAMGAWARLLAGLGGRPVPAETGRVYADHPAAPAPEVDAPQPGPEELVSRFRSTASPHAMNLAVFLSAAPLVLPVMRMVQHTMLPGSGPSDLAEVLLSGLLRRSGEEPGDWYEFVPGVRDVLLGPLDRDDARLVLKHCSDYVRRHFGRGARDFPALAVAQLDRAGRLPRQEPAAAEVPVPRPFAEVPAAVVRRFLEPAREEPPAGEDASPDATDLAWPVQTARTLVADYERDGNQNGLHTAAAVLRRAAQGLHDDVPGNGPGGEVRFELGRVLLKLWAVQHDPRLLEEAETVLRRVTAVPGMVRARAVLGQVLYEQALAARPAPSAQTLSEAEQEFAAVCVTEGVEYELGRDCAVRRAEILLRLHRLQGAPGYLRDAVATLEEFELREGRLRGKPDSTLHLVLGRVLLALAEADPQPASAEAAAEQLAVGLAVLDPEAPASRRARARLDLADALSRVPGRTDEALDHLERALTEATGDQPLRLAVLMRTARVHRARHATGRDPADLDAAAAAYAAARPLAARDDDRYADLLPEWGETLLELAATAHGAGHVSTAVQVLRESRAALPRTDPESARRLLALARGLRLRYRHERDMVDLWEAEHLLSLAAKAPGDPLLRARAWREHGDVQLELHDRTADFGWLEHAADSYRRAWRAALDAGGERRLEGLRYAARLQQLRGQVLERMGRPRGALDAYRIALDLWTEAETDVPERDGETAEGAERAADTYEVDTVVLQERIRALQTP
jgi:tetratricopeptide (TPR) repeat protein